MDDIVNRDETLFEPARFDAESYEDILDRDLVPSPDFLREGPNSAVGVEPVAVERYYDPAFFRKEVNHVWPRVWQWACREEEIPEIGDHIVYDIAGYSFIIVRSTESEIKALYNSCLHRGRQLAEADGSRKSVV